MKKTYLRGYAPTTFQALNSGGVTYVLQLKTVWFGLFSKLKTHHEVIPEHTNFKATLDNWDKLIETQSPLR